MGSIEFPIAMDGYDVGSNETLAALQIVIVGAGIGGLSAGTALRRQGHSVTILESSAFSQEIGAAINIPPYAAGIYERLGIDLDKNDNAGAMECTGCNIWAGIPGRQIMFLDYHASRDKWQHPRRLVHRAHLHTLLRETATAKKGPGIPCTLRLSSKVVHVDTEAAQVRLENGDVISGDLVIGADGIHSQCRSFVGEGAGFRPYESGISAFRFIIPTELLAADPVTKDMLGARGNLIVAMGSGIKRLVCYPCAKNTMTNCIYLHPTDDSRESKIPAKQLMMQIAGEFAAPIRAIMEKASEDAITIWKLLEMPPLPTWVDNKLVLMGDAAHPMLPHRGEGAAQAVEDAAALGALLPLGTRRDELDERMVLYEKCRKHRATMIQQASRMNSRPMDVQKKHGFSPVAADNYSFSHDQWHHATDALFKLKMTKESHPWSWRQPVSFGPHPGPERSLPDRIATPTSPKSELTTTYSIQFATSKTYLQGLFPNNSFSFVKPDTAVFASWVCKSFQNVAWLGGSSYHSVALHIHGAQYTQANGEKVIGSFVPVVFENQASAITFGREQRGAPVLPCDIDVSDRNGYFHISLSWQGTPFGQLSLLQKQADNKNANAESANEHVAVSSGFEDDSGLLMYRYIPAIGQPGKADAEYAIFEPGTNGVQVQVNGTELPEQVGPEAGAAAAVTNADSKHELPLSPMVHTAPEASCAFTAVGLERLPTLNPVVSMLQDIPVYKIVERRIETAAGGDQFILGRRLY